MPPPTPARFVIRVVVDIDPATRPGWTWGRAERLATLLSRYAGRVRNVSQVRGVYLEQVEPAHTGPEPGVPIPQAPEGDL